MPEPCSPRGPVGAGRGDTPILMFHGAWRRFASVCGATAAPEATYQAWFAHFLIEVFGVLRVVREVDFGARYLVDDADRARFPGHNLMTDVMVLREPIVDLPRRAWLASKGDPDAHRRSGLGRLALFDIVCELKVSASHGGGVAKGQVLRDGYKLDALARAAAHHIPDDPVPEFAVCLLDNHPGRPMDVAALRIGWEQHFPEGRVQLVVATPGAPPSDATTSEGLIDAP